ncbi:hypothetical protein [Peribacillus frigoritolerans]|uniref:DUF3168 domain-containing protein n=1 Tax=Peribacillus castrilensis TaxID=2897690 RepID=A0AAW9NL17_9BACI|nr:hypothetical protein [Peribacillus castrilensis]
MSVVNLYNGIYKVLANDKTVLSYLGIGATATPLEKAKRIQKRHKPQNLVENMPIITFYAPPGTRSRENLLVYSTNFIFDIYTNDNVDLAQKLGGRLVQIFDGEINPMMGIETYESLLVTMHETATDMANTYCFTVVVEFSFSLEKL